VNREPEEEKSPEEGGGVGAECGYLVSEHPDESCTRWEGCERQVTPGWK
jgi:hypothetical protein